MIRQLVAVLVIVAALSGVAFAQSSSGYPYPGCKVVASTTGGDAVGHVQFLQACAAGCSLCDLSGFNTNAVVRYIMLFAAAACPATGSIPLLEIQAPATSQFSEVGFGEWYPSGLIACVSTTEGTYTATGTNDAYIHIAVQK